MLYYLFEFLDKLNLPGAGLFDFISFRASMALIFSLIFSIIIGKRMINALRKQQIGETVRDLGLAGQIEKSGTPTMGGLIILGAILIPTLLFAKLHNVYVITMVLSTIWLGLIGFLDDYIKVFKKDKEGLAGRFKVLGQIGIGLIVGIVMVFHSDIVVKDEVSLSSETEVVGSISLAQKSSKTTTPFFKNNEFDYQLLTSWMGDTAKDYAWILFILIVVVIVTDSRAAVPPATFFNVTVK